MVPFRRASGGVRGRSNHLREFSGGLREGVGERLGADLGGPEGSISVFLFDVSIFQKTCSRCSENTIFEVSRVRKTREFRSEIGSDNADGAQARHKQHSGVSWTTFWRSWVCLGGSGVDFGRGRGRPRRSKNVQKSVLGVSWARLGHSGASQRSKIEIL